MSAANTLPRRERLRGIDGLRALAAISILLDHCWLYSSRVPIGSHFVRGLIPYLSLGVTLFFTLSGFLLWRPFAAALLAGDPRPSTRRYLRHRALRIVPAYWVALGVCGLVLGGTLVRISPTLVSLGRIHDPLRLIDTAALVQNLAPGTLETGLGPAWTLSIEVAFYLALPLFALACFAIARRWRTRASRRMLAALPAVAMLGIGLAGKFVMSVIVPAPPGSHAVAAAGTWAYPANWHTVIQLSAFGQADLFAFGLLLAVVHAEVQAGSLTLPRGWRRYTLAAACLVGIVSLLFVHGAELAASPANTGVALTFALLLAVIVLEPRERQWSLRMLEWRPLVLVGIASYSVFLWNDSIERLLERHGLTLAGAAGLPLNVLVLAVIVGVVATLSYLFVERPALRLKRRSAAGHAPAVAAARVR